MRIPANLRHSCNASASRLQWLADLPELINELESRWELSVQRDEPYDSSAAWVASARRRDGSRAILKLIMPHFEAMHEIQGLVFWNGDPTVCAFESNASSGAVLLEECRPGIQLTFSPPDQQDEIIAGLLRRAWKPVSASAPFRPLAQMVRFWAEEVTRASYAWPDSTVVKRGLEIMAELASNASRPVLLVTDLHAGNVLRAQRAPWLVVDPKPFIGDPAYDATQHLLNCRDRLGTDPEKVIDRFSDLLDVDAVRVRRWLYARLVADPRAAWEEEPFALAETLRI